MYIFLNQKPITVNQDQTILNLTEEQGIFIPTLCHMKGLPNFTSCMLCLVQETKSGRLLPACSALVQDGMHIETDNRIVHQARKNALDLLLSEHVGDCQAPCQRGCPADMNIPQMLRHISQGRFRDALITVKQDIALPAILGRICPAPCEKVCNRALHDTALAICHLKKFVADLDLASERPWEPLYQPNSDKRIAIVGAGPAGLAAAFYLMQQGHHCTLFDDHDQAGGMLRYGVEPSRLEHGVLDGEIKQSTRHHIVWRLHTQVGRDVPMAVLHEEYDAIALTCGSVDEHTAHAFGVAFGSRGIEVDRVTFHTNIDKVFSAGNSIGSSRMAVRSVGQGKEMAVAIDQFLRGEKIVGVQRHFNSRLGRLDKHEVKTLVAALTPCTIQPANAEMAEAARCLHCDCRKPDDCKLRMYAEKYGAEQARFKGERKKISFSVQHDLVIYEPGKCIKCGLCVRITEKAAEPLGLAFIGRGFDVRIDVPFNESLREGLQKTARECAAACPTAAIALKLQAKNNKIPTG